MKRCIDAYHFVLQSLDTETALAVANEAPDEHEAADAYDAMMRILRDRGVVTQMNLVVRLLKLKGEDGTDPLVVMRQQAQLACDQARSYGLHSTRTAAEGTRPVCPAPQSPAFDDEVHRRRGDTGDTDDIDHPEDKTHHSVPSSCSW